MRRLLFLALAIAITLVPLLSIAEGPAGESVIIQQYRKAMELDPGNTSIRYKLSIALLREKFYQEALTHLLVLEEKEPGDPEITYYLGIAYAGTDDLDRAFESYKRVMELDPRKASLFELDKVFYNLGVSYQRKENMIDALKAYEKSIEINPSQVHAYCRRGEVFFDMKSYDDAIEDLKRCSERLPEDARGKRFLVSTHLSRGLSLMGEKRYEAASLDFKKVRELDPANESAAYFLGYLYYQLSDYREAYAAISSIRSPETGEIIEDMPSLLQNIALELQKREDWDTAEKALRQAIEMRRKDPDLHYLLGLNFRGKGLYEEAVYEIKEALRLAPEHRKANLALAVLTDKLIEEHLKKGEGELLRGNLAAAVEEFEEVLRIDPLNQRGFNGKKEAEERMRSATHDVSKKKYEEINLKTAEAERHLSEGRYRDALLAFRHVLDMDPGNSSARKGLETAESLIREKKGERVEAGDSYYAEKNYHSALKEYKSALALDPDDGVLQTKVSAAEKLLSSKVTPLLGKGVSQEEAEDFRGALKTYGEVLEYDPENIEALKGKTRAGASLESKFQGHLARGREHRSKGEYAEAVRDLRLAGELKPGDEDVEKELENALPGLNVYIDRRLGEASGALGRGDFVSAEAAYGEVVSLDPENVHAKEGLTDARRLKSEAAAKKVSAAEGAFARGSYSEAYRLYGEALEIDGGNEAARARQAEAMNLLLKGAIARYNRGDARGAAEDFKRVLDLDPSNRTARKYMSSISREKGAARIDEKEVERLYLKGIELYTEGKYLDAIKAWEKVLQADPKHEKARFNIEKAKKKLEGVMDVK